MSVNKTIRDKIRSELTRRGFSQAEFARQAGIPPDYFSKMMREETGGIPKHWARAFDALKLTLTVTEAKDPAPNPSEAEK